MTEQKISLNSDELDMLARLVGSALGETRVEVHRTHYQPAFREDVKREETLLRGLLEKLSQAVAVQGGN